MKKDPCLHRGVVAPRPTSLSTTRSLLGAPIWRRMGKHLSLALLGAAALWAGEAMGQSIYVLTTTNRLLTIPATSPGLPQGSIAITGIAAGETLVDIDIRPQNQQLYGLGVNPTTNKATLYHIAPETGIAAVVGSVGSVAFTTDGTTPVALPDPAGARWAIDFNPAVDRLRVVGGSLNFRVNPNTGGPIDGDNTGLTSGTVTGFNPDGAINTGTTTLSGVAYTNNQPNNGGTTTLYTVEAGNNMLFIQNPPNEGTQSLGQTITLSGSTLDFSDPAGFDIPEGVNAGGNNLPVGSGSGFLLTSVGGVLGLYSVDLTNAQATLIGTLPPGTTSRGIAIRTESNPIIALDPAGPNVVRFDAATPGTTTTQALNTTLLASGETLVGFDFRPQTGQFYALGVKPTVGASTGSLYLIDPQTGALTPVGTASQISFVTAGGTAIDLPDPATTGYGFDFNPTVDRIRVTTSTGLNFRLNPITGGPVDSDTVNAGTQPDGAINGLPGGSTGVDGAAYTNSYAQSLTGGVTTLYTLDAASNSLYIQNPPNAGTQTQALPITLGGNGLDFTTATGFDIPGTVAVTTSNMPAKGDGWLVATVAGTTGLYRVNLATGAATSIGAVGTSLAGLATLFPPRLPAVVSNDTVTVVGPSSRLYVLANDGLSDGAVITGVSNPAITISGRSLVIPSSFTGTFTYFTVDGGVQSVGTVTVVAGVAVMNPTTFTGLLTTATGEIVGTAKASVSTKGVVTVQLLGGTLKTTAKITLPTGVLTGAAFTPLGYLTVTKNADNLVVSLEALGGALGATLRAVPTTATAAKYHIALASPDSDFPGGGYVIATVSKKGAVALTGLLPDGVPFSAATALRDDNTFVFYSVAAKTKPPTVVAGEFTPANLTATDVTGELAWLKRPQVAGVKGVHLTGADTNLTANGSLFDGTAALPTGNGTLTLSGGNLAATEMGPVVITTKGVPTVPAGSLKTWTGVSAKVGKFSATVAVPTVAKPVKGSGLYLPKSNSAWGYFPGTTVGGRIQLTQP